LTTILIRVVIALMHFLVVAVQVRAHEAVTAYSDEELI
jgi:hypothetical protein